MYFFDGENISFDASLVLYIYIYIYIYINSTNISPIMIINRIYEHQNLLSLYLFSFLDELRTYQHPDKFFVFHWFRCLIPNVLYSTVFWNTFLLTIKTGYISQNTRTGGRKIPVKANKRYHFKILTVHRNSLWYSEGGGKLEYCKTRNFSWQYFTGAEWGRRNIRLDCTCLHYLTLFYIQESINALFEKWRPMDGSLDVFNFLSRYFLNFCTRFEKKSMTFTHYTGVWI
jgi:hypothetical protein